MCTGVVRVIKVCTGVVRVITVCAGVVRVITVCAGVVRSITVCAGVLSTRIHPLRSVAIEGPCTNTNRIPGLNHKKEICLCVYMCSYVKYYFWP